MKITRRMESLVRLGIIAVGLYLAAASVVLYLQLNRLRGAEQYVEHTQDVRHALQEVLVQALEAESTQRAFVIRKNEIYLTEHFAAVAALRSGIARVAELTRDNPLQAARAKDLSDLIEVRIAQMKASLDFVHDIDKVTAPESFRSGALRKAAAGVRDGIQQMLGEEDRLFAERTAAMQSMLRLTIIIFVALLVLLVGVAVAYFIFTARNLALRNAMVAELTEAKAASERADTFKGDLLSYLGRALHRPLTDIASVTDLLLYRATDNLADKDQRLVTEIRTRARFLLSLATNFLHIGRLQAGKPLKLLEDDTDLVDVIREAIGIYANGAAKAGVALGNAAPFTRALVRCDKQKLRQILINLLDNAVKHTPSGGSVDVAVGQASSGDMVVTIRDTGPGIPPPRLKQVTIPFAQIENMFEREEQGIGLGLPMAMGFAQAHGGSLNLSSGLEGTTAVLTLPASRIIKVFAQS